MPEEFTDIIEDLYEIYAVAAFNKELSLEELSEFERRLGKMKKMIKRLKMKKQSINL